MEKDFKSSIYYDPFYEKYYLKYPKYDDESDEEYQSRIEEQFNLDEETYDLFIHHL